MQDNILRQRNRAQELNIDAYVLERASVIGMFYREYRTHLHDHDAVHVVFYERMVTDTLSWLQDIATHLCLLIEPAEMMRIARAADFSPPAEEQPSLHRRQILPGDHRRKLKPATISELNRQLADVLEAFGYAA